MVVAVIVAKLESAAKVAAVMDVVVIQLTVVQSKRDFLPLSTIKYIQTFRVFIKL